MPTPSNRYSTPAPTCSAAAPTSAADREISIARPLLAWYRANRRDLPWRRQDDPYAVWISEIMLQQTQVATVVPYFERWMARFPTVEALATATLEEALRLWAGLGYYARARNLHRAAAAVVARHDGVVPCDPRALAALPGIGRYTAGAILSIAYNLPAPIVDANVARVLSRVFALAGDPKAAPASATIWRLAEELIPPGEACDFNQALMELGALVCTPAEPACDRCPLLAACAAGNSADPTAWPLTPAGRATVRVTHACIAIESAGYVLLARRPPHGLWGGLWEFPRRVCAPGEPPEQCAARAAREILGVEANVSARVQTVKHSVTHHAITLHAYAGSLVSGEPTLLDCAEARWVEPGQLCALPLSAPQALVARAVVARSRP